MDTAIEEERSEFAVGVVLIDKGADRIELRLNDLEPIQKASPPAWRLWAYYTSLRFDQETLDGDLTDEQYALIGKLVVARLKGLKVLQKQD